MRPTHRFRPAIFAAATLGLLAGTAAPALAAPTPVTVSALNDAAVSWSDDCEGTRSTTVIHGIVDVTREAPLDEPLEVTYTVGGDTTPGFEYEALPGSITIPAGEDTAQIEVVPLEHAGGGVLVTITLDETADVSADGDPTATVGLNEVSSASQCDDVTIGWFSAPDLYDPVECDVHGNTTSLPTESRHGTVEVERVSDRDDLVVQWELTDPRGERAPVTGEVTIANEQTSAQFFLPKLPAGALGEFRLLRNPDTYALFGTTSESFEVVHGPITGGFCVGPYDYGDRDWSLAVGDALPEERWPLDGGNIQTGMQVFRLASGALPPGLSVDPSAGLVGTPTGGGDFTFVIENCQVEGDDEACAASNFNVTVLGAALLPATGTNVPQGATLALLLMASGALVLQRAQRSQDRQRMVARMTG